MMSVLTLLRKMLIVEYYRLNVGFLFLISMFAFGILRPEDHIALAAYIFASPFLLALLMGIFLLYHLKIVFFVRQRLLWDSYEVLYQLVLIPKRQRWGAWLYVQFALWLPVLLYAVFVGFYGWKFGQQKAVVVTFIYVLLLPLTGTMAYEYRLFRPNPDTQLHAFGGYFNRRFTKPYWSYFLFYLFKQNPVLLFTTKAFTCFTVMVVCKIYPTDDYDERLLSLGMLVVGLVHSVLLLHLYEFEHLQLPLLRNLPIKLQQRARQYLLLVALLLLPECLFLVRYFPETVHISYGIQWWGLGIGLLWLIFGRFMQQHYTMDALLRQGVYVFFVGFFLIMFKTPVSILTLLSLLTGTYLFFRFYYSSEYIVHQASLKTRPEEFSLNKLDV